MQAISINGATLPAPFVTSITTRAQVVPRGTVWTLNYTSLDQFSAQTFLSAQGLSVLRLQFDSGNWTPTIPVTLVVTIGAIREFPPAQVPIGLIILGSPNLTALQQSTFVQNVQIKATLQTALLLYDSVFPTPYGL